MAKVYAPNRTYGGVTAGVRFHNGVGETDNPGALSYLSRVGYGIDGPPPAPPGRQIVDARSATTVVVGTPLRDAAVDPRPSDFMPPANAGEADPHGPLVVSPQIHASNTGPIVAGGVRVDEPAIQEANQAAADEGDTTAPAAIARPRSGATKAQWVEYAVEQGIAREEAEDLSIAQIRERIAE